MKLIIKELKGAETEIDNLSEDTQILEIKQQIETQSNLPVQQQKLLYLGKILQDTQTLGSYNIKDGSKLMLTKLPKPTMQRIAANHFGKYYDAETSALLATKLVESIKGKINNEFSLDDIERLACKVLNKEF